jgi:hypothetical protein
LQGGRCIHALSADHRDIGLGNRQIGTGHILVALRLLGALDRGDILLRQLPAGRRFAASRCARTALARTTAASALARLAAHWPPPRRWARATRASCSRLDAGGQFLPLCHPVARIDRQAVRAVFPTSNPTRLRTRASTVPSP